MRKKLLYRIAIVVCLAVFLFSCYKLVDYYLTGYQEESLYQDLLQQVQDAQQAAQDQANQAGNQTGNTDGNGDSNDGDSAGNTGTSDGNGDSTGNTGTSDGSGDSTGNTGTSDGNTGSGNTDTDTGSDVADPEPPPLYADSGRLYRYDALYLQNTDLVGWIYVPGTSSGYPVMQTPNNEEYYLRRNFYKKYAHSGTPFLDKDSDLEDPASRIMVYGHNLKNGNMFSPFTKYTKASHWKKYPTFTFDTLYESRTYRILAVVQVDITQPGHFAYYAYDRFSSAAAFNGFVQEAKAASLYDTGVTAEYGQQLMIISTCSYHVEGNGGRLAIIAVQEPAQ